MLGDTSGSGGASGEIRVQKERRLTLRVPILVRRVTVGGRGNVFFGYAGNLSASGMFIGTVNPRKKGEQFAIQFTLPGSTVPISVTAEVVWVREHSQNADFPPGMGVMFVDIDVEAVQKIRQYVATYTGAK